VDENTADNTNIGSPITASDTDAGTTFSSWAIQSGNTNNVFALNATTGQLSVNDQTKLDFESISQYTLSITVSDGTNTCSPVNVVVNVNDLNDNTPIITSNQSFQLSETSENNKLIGSIKATDSDAGTNFSNWTIVAGFESGIFKINKNTGDLTVANNTNLDFETTKNYNLTLSVSDGKNTSSLENITISIVDKNDEIPIISPSQKFTISENTNNSKLLGTLVASDKDTNTTFTNWEIKSGNENQIFTLNPTSGKLIVSNNEKLDFETSQVHNLSVQVSDGLNISKIENIIIHITDIDDEAPIIEANQIFHITENSKKDVVIGKIKITDADTDNSSCRFLCVGENNDSPFHICSKTGNISSKNCKLIDRELTNKYLLEIEATDGVNKSKHQMVTVIIDDVNDNAPIVVANQEFHIYENSEKGTLVGKIQIVDPDPEAIAPCHYVCNNENSESAFHICPKTGRITVKNKSKVNFEENKLFDLSIVADDGVNTGNLTHLKVIVDDVNEAPTAHAGENQISKPKATVVLNASASSDPENDQLTYKWTAPASIQLSDVNAPNPTFKIPAIYDNLEYIFYLEVSDGEYTSNRAKVIVKSEFAQSKITHDFMEKNTTIYPNPANQEFSLKLPKKPKDKAIVRIIDLTGKVFYEAQTNDIETKFYFELASGMYIVSIISDDYKIIKRILVQH
jgi:hypothetical protein